MLAANQSGVQSIKSNDSSPCSPARPTIACTKMPNGPLGLKCSTGSASGLKRYFLKFGSDLLRHPCQVVSPHYRSADQPI